MCFGKEVVGIHTCSQHGSQRTSTLIRFNRSSQYNQICINMQLFIGDQIGSLYFQGAICLRHNLADHTFNIMYSILFNSTTIELIIILTWCTNINVEYINIRIRIFFTAIHCMLCCIHTTNLRAVFLSASRCITAADALYKDNLLRLLAIGWTLQVTFCRAICLQDTFKFQRGNNILALRIREFIIIFQTNRIITSCSNNCTVFLLNKCFLLAVINCAGRTKLFTQTALALCQL